MNVKILEQKTFEVVFNAFGRDFSYTLHQEPKGIKNEEIVGILSRQLQEVRYEWGRQDNKQVLLFYSSSKENSGYLRFSFAVEADSELQMIMKRELGHKDKISLMLNYMYKNQDKLNFNA